MHAQLSAALLRAQRELSQTRCDQCQQQLRQPHRMLGCRHVICGLCAESTIRYWDECPFCGITTHTSRGDPCHAMVLRQREADWERLQVRWMIGQRGPIATPPIHSSPHSSRTHHHFHHFPHHHHQHHHHYHHHHHHHHHRPYRHRYLCRWGGVDFRNLLQFLFKNKICGRG